MVQRGKGVEQRVISGQCTIFLSLHDRIDPETRKRDPHHAGIKKLPWAFNGSNLWLRRSCDSRCFDRDRFKIAGNIRSVPRFLRFPAPLGFQNPSHFLRSTSRSTLTRPSPLLETPFPELKVTARAIQTAWHTLYGLQQSVPGPARPEIATP